MGSRAAIAGEVTGEFANAKLGDERRSKRLLEIVGLLDASPAAGFPRALGSEAHLEAFYRFINNEDFEPEDVLEPHLAATMARARVAGRVVVVHDTTSVEYTTPAPRKGLGWTTARGRQGFLAHTSLVMTVDGLPLGVGHLETLTRSGKKRRARKVTHKVVSQDAGRESLRWIRGVRSIEDAREDHGFEAVHVTDAEGDFFELLALLYEDDASFVIRAGQLDRCVKVDGVHSRVRDVVDAIEPRVSRCVALSERGRGDRPRAIERRHPARASREADLSMGTTRITLAKTKYSDAPAEPFEVNVVRVWEPAPPQGESPIEWVLFTSEDVSTKAKILELVDMYRLRWTIEEFFKALKTGCALERRQVESYDALCKVLALFVPIAYRLLLLRGLERRAPTAGVKLAFSETEIHLMCNAPSNRALPPPLTIAEGLAHLARLGGHLKRNGPPGWFTIGQGYEKLLLLRIGWELALQSLGRSDQS